MEKTESTRIQLTNHEKALIRKLAREVRKAEKQRQKQIKKEDAEDAPFRRKIVK